MESRVDRAHVDLMNAYEICCIEEDKQSVENWVSYHITNHGYGAPGTFIEFILAADSEHDCKGDLYDNYEDKGDLREAKTEHT